MFHRKILRDNIYGVTNGVIVRLARKSGIKRLGADSYEQVRNVIFSTLALWLQKVIVNSKHLRKKTIGVMAIEGAIPSVNVFEDGIIPKLSFVAQDFENDLRFTNDALVILQNALEIHIVDILKQAQMRCRNAKRETVHQFDFIQ